MDLKYFSKNISPNIILFYQKYEGTLRHKIHYRLKTVLSAENNRAVLSLALGLSVCFIESRSAEKVAAKCLPVHVVNLSHKSSDESSVLTLQPVA